MSNPRRIDGGRLKGLVTATFTPLRADGSANVERIPEVVDYLVERGMVGLYVLGSTGEGLSFTEAERRSLTESFVQAATGRLPVIAHVGCECLADARRLAEHAQQVGAAGISAVSPLYFKPPSIEALVESMGLIASGAPSLPFYYYHIPAVTGLDFSMLDFLRLGAEKIPNLAGIKFSSPNAEEFAACVEFAQDEFQLLWGVDERLYDGLRAGAEAAVGSTYNFVSPLYRKLLAAFAAGDHAVAREQQTRAQEIVDTFVAFGSRPAQKAMMAMVGPDCGPCRLPLQALPPVQNDALRKALEDIGFFGHATETVA